MGHGIMSFDKVVSRRSTEWHGLAIHIDHDMNVDEAAKESGLDSWNPVEQDLFVGEKKIDTHKVITRSDNSFPLGVVGKNYNPLSNKDFLEFITSLTEDRNAAQIESMGSFYNGKDIIATVTIPREYRIKNDEMRPYLLLSNNNAGERKFTLGYCATRVICNNTHRVALREMRGHNNVEIKHTKNSKIRMEEVRKILDIGYRSFDTMQEEMVRLIAETSSEKINRFYEMVVPLPEKPVDATPKAIKAWNNRVLKAKDLRAEMRRRMLTECDILGQTPNLWLAYNSYTHNKQHFGRVNNEDDDRFARVYSINFGNIGASCEEAYNIAFGMLNLEI